MGKLVAGAASGMSKKAAKTQKRQGFAKAFKRATQNISSAIPKWLTTNLSYFQMYYNQLHSAQNRTSEVTNAKKQKLDRAKCKNTAAGSPTNAKAAMAKVAKKVAKNDGGRGKTPLPKVSKSPLPKVAGAKYRRKEKVDLSNLEAPELSDSFNPENEDISPYTMICEVCKLRKELQDHRIATVYLEEGLNELFADLTDGKKEHVKIRQDDDKLVPKYSKTSNMDETCFGYALCLMGSVITPAFANTVETLLKKKMKSTGYTIMRAPCKTFSRMFNKLQSDHKDAKPPRYALNVDVVRMGVVFDTPMDLINAMKVLNKNMEIIRTKNSFVMQAGETPTGYRACLLNLRFQDPANATCKMMSENAKERWDRYLENTKDRHKNYVMKAMKWLSSRAMAKKEVAMACEIQLIYKPYYFYRKNVHFLYKVTRTDNMEQFLRDFEPKTEEAARKEKNKNARRSKWAATRSTQHSVRLIGAITKKEKKEKKPSTIETKEDELLPKVKSASSLAAASAADLHVIEEVHLPTINSKNNEDVSDPMVS